MRLLALSAYTSVQYLSSECQDFPVLAELLWSLAHVIDVNADEKFATVLHKYWMRLNWTFKARIELFCFSCIQFRKEPPTRRKKLDNPDQAFLILGKNGSKYVQID